MINAVGSHAVGGANGNIQEVAIRAYELRTGRAGQGDGGALGEGAGLGVELVKVDGFVIAGGNGNQKGGINHIHNWERPE